MKQQYIDLMEKALSAYTDEHILRYFNEVREKGLTEHGFPRLTANIGILIAHGRRTDLLPIFLEMMEFCCKHIPHSRAANDFSVREIVCCLWEVERSGVARAEDTRRWRAYFATIVPTTCYNRFATTPADDVRNWALFTAVSEFFRQKAGLCDSSEFIDLQIACQLKFFDENGMYLDKEGTDVHQPIMYDLVSRGLFALLLGFGYRGQYYERIDAILKRSALLTLRMQSSGGELAFGGRSNQFLHNEAWLAVIYEYEAARYAREGDGEMARAFKSAIVRGIAVTEAWLAKVPIRHIKNRFPTETKYGCEKYAYFDKYMITAASNLYAAYLLCDESIPTVAEADVAPVAWQTSAHFHKVFLKSGGYSLELDTNADPDYDACGVGRIHRAGAPSTICLSLPCPAAPQYALNLEDPIALSLCPAVWQGGEWRLATDVGTPYEVRELWQTDDAACATVACDFAEQGIVTASYTVSAEGVCVDVRGAGEIGYALPAFLFDGEGETEIIAEDGCLTVSYEGWICRYTTDGRIADTGKRAANRNGHYRAFLATATETLRVRIEICRR